MRRLASFAYSVTVRAIVAMGGALAAYGATGMFTTAGVMPPNSLVLTGALVVIIAMLAAWAKERRIDAVWAALLFAIPYALYAWGSWGQVECAPDHPPITPTFSCAPIGSHAIGILAPLIAVVAVFLFVRDMRTLARVATSAA